MKQQRDLIFLPAAKPEFVDPTFDDSDHFSIAQQLRWFGDCIRLVRFADFIPLHDSDSGIHDALLGFM